jgi:hypothetical protein
MLNLFPCFERNKWYVCVSPYMEMNTDALLDAIWYRALVTSCGLNGLVAAPSRGKIFPCTAVWNQGHSDEICALLGYYAAWVVILYRRFGTTYRSHLQKSESPRIKLSSWTSWPLRMGPICCPETSVKSYHSTLRNIPEEHRSHQHRGGSMKSRTPSLASYLLDSAKSFPGGEAAGT